jgi:hypothetical protein
MNIEAGGSDTSIVELRRLVEERVVASTVLVSNFDLMYQSIPVSHDPYKELQIRWCRIDVVGHVNKSML